MTVSASTKTFENNWRTADPISVKLAQYVYHLNMFHLLKTEGVNQMKGNRGQFQINKKCQEFIKCCKAGNFLLSLIYLQQIYILGMLEKRGEGLYFPCAGVPLPNEPVSQYKCVNLPKTDDDDRTHENDSNALDIWSMLLSGQVPHRTNPNQLFWNGLFQKKEPNRVGGLMTYFFEKTPGIVLVFLCTPGNFR